MAGKERFRASAESMADIRENQGPIAPTGRAFQLLSLTTVAAVFALVTLGGVVRVTDSGLGCPDWPLCHGRLFPPLESGPLIEYSHRLAASVTGFLVLAMAIVAWTTYSHRRWLLAPASLGLLLVIAQVLVGRFTVESELSGGLVLVHLALAQGLVATLLVLSIVALQGDPAPSLWRRDRNGRRWLLALSVGSAAATYGLLLLGSYVTVSNAGLACGSSWPLCLGHGVFPSAHAPFIHMLHRGGALLVGLLLLVTGVVALRREGGSGVKWLAAGAGGLLLAQVLIGAANVWLGLPMLARLLHLVLATAFWGAVVVFAFLVMAAAPVPVREVTRA